MIKEFSEYPNVEENDYDINSSLTSNSIPSNDPNNNAVIDEEIIEEEDTLDELMHNPAPSHETYTVLEEDNIFDAYPKTEPVKEPEKYEEVIEEDELTPPPIVNNPPQGGEKPSLEEIIGKMFENGEGDARYNGDDYIDEEIIEGTPERPIVDDIIDDLAENEMSDDAYEGYDFFLDDENIGKTLEKYKYNYARLIKRLTFTLNQMEIEDMLNECGIGLAEYENPTPEIFERLRKQVMNGKQHKI